MKRKHARIAALGTALVAAGLTGCSDSGTPADAIPDGTTVTLALLETTDIHSNVLGYNYYSLSDDPTVGLDRTATLIQGARAETRTTCCSTTATSSRARCWATCRPSRPPSSATRRWPCTRP